MDLESEHKKLSARDININNLKNLFHFKMTFLQNL